MKERVKIYTSASGEGPTLIEPELEDHINNCLRRFNGTIVKISLSECQRSNSAHHTSVCVGLAILRRVYTKSQIDYVIEAAIELYADRDALRGLRVIEAPPALRHFSAKFAEC